jgi:hypothetical protein
MKNPHYLQDLKDNIQTEIALILNMSSIMCQETFSVGGRPAKKLEVSTVTLFYEIRVR